MTGDRPHVTPFPMFTGRAEEAMERYAVPFSDREAPMPTDDDGLCAQFAPVNARFRDPWPADPAR